MDVFIQKSNFDFSKLAKEIMNEETYKVLEKYNCFETINRLSKEHNINSAEDIDLLAFFMNTKVTKIVYGAEEIIINDLPSNEMLFIDYKFKSMKEFIKKIDYYVDKYNIDDFNILFEFYEEDKDDFILLLHQDEFKYDYDYLKKIIEKYGG